MNKQMKIPLYDALKEHLKREPISFHVPGHKYGSIQNSAADDSFQGLLQLDATELTGLDDLHSPGGPILEAETLLADLYHVQKSFFLINGSTVGNLAMIMAACAEDDLVLVQRNCHKSVLNALRLAKVRPVFLEPEFNQEWKTAAGISIETAKQAIRLYPNAKALIVTYPNYYGMAYNVKEIIEEAHQHKIPVLVDEAHGPHFIIGEPFPPSTIQLGADIAVQSAHKTLPAMTMGSFLHFNSRFLNVNKLKDYLQVFQSSSPSYPIMASLDLARNYAASYTRDDLTYLLKEINFFKKQLGKIPAIKVLEYPNEQGDFLKITIQSRCGLSGFELQRRLEDLSIYTELADPYNVLFILPLLKEGQANPLAEAGRRIYQVLKDLPVHEVDDKVIAVHCKISELAIPYKEMAQFAEKEVEIKDALGLACAETIIPYPPGVPLLYRGEQITIDKLDQLHQLIQSGARFQGGSTIKEGLIKVFETA